MSNPKLSANLWLTLLFNKHVRSLHYRIHIHPYTHRQETMETKHQKYVSPNRHDLCFIKFLISAEPWKYSAFPCNCRSISQSGSAKLLPSPPALCQSSPTPPQENCAPYKKKKKSRGHQLSSSTITPKPFRPIILLLPWPRKTCSSCTSHSHVDLPLFTYLSIDLQLFSLHSFLPRLIKTFKSFSGRGTKHHWDQSPS